MDENTDFMQSDLIFDDDREIGDVDNILYLHVSHEIRSEKLQAYVDAITKPRLYSKRSGHDIEYREMSFIEALEEKLNWRLIHAAYPNTGSITMSTVRLVWKMSEGLVRGKSLDYSMRLLGRGADKQLLEHYEEIRECIHQETQNIYSALEFDPELLGRDKYIWIRDVDKQIFLINVDEAWPVLKKLEIKNKGKKNRQLKRERVIQHANLGAVYIKDFPEEEDLSKRGKNWLFNLSSIRAKSAFQKVSYLLQLLRLGDGYHGLPRHLKHAKLKDLNVGSRSLYIATSSEHIYEIPSEKDELDKKLKNTRRVTTRSGEEVNLSFDLGVYKANKALRSYLNRTPLPKSGKEVSSADLGTDDKSEKSDHTSDRGYRPIREVFDSRARMAHLLNVRPTGSQPVGQGMVCKVIDVSKSKEDPSEGSKAVSSE